MIPLIDLYLSSTASARFSAVLSLYLPPISRARISASEQTENGIELEDAIELGNFLKGKMGDYRESQ